MPKSGKLYEIYICTGHMVGIFGFWNPMVFGWFLDLIFGRGAEGVSVLLSL